jgi:hypothetical protein
MTTPFAQPECPATMSRSDNTDPTHEFLTHADRILREARFVADSIPNVEPTSAERALRQLHAIHLILLNLNDPWLAASEIQGYVNMVLEVSQVLQTFHDSPPPPHNIGTSTILSQGRGRPR